MLRRCAVRIDVRVRFDSARLADIAAKNAMATDKAGCGALINTATPADSVLIKRIKGMGACGPQMPLGAPLTPDEMKCLEDWVNMF